MPIIDISDVNNIQSIDDLINFTRSMIVQTYLNKVYYLNNKWYVLNDDDQLIESESSDYIKIMCKDIQLMVISKILECAIPRTKHNYDIFKVLDMDFFVNTMRDESEHLFYV